MRFLRFGLVAWGGPVAQIAMIRHELVDEEKWVSNERFNRVLAVYQVLPGPEAHEMCVYFGTVRGGRLGGLMAGLGFMLRCRRPYAAAHRHHRCADRPHICSSAGNRSLLEVESEYTGSSADWRVDWMARAVARVSLTIILSGLTQDAGRVSVFCRIETEECVSPIYIW
jgi:hypothetical protein